MFAGHLAAGLVLKKMEGRINLAWLFFAALFHDFLLGIFTLFDVERIVIPANYAQARYMSFDFRYSHTLTASIVWSLLGLAITYAVLSKWTSRERVRAGVAIGLTIFSHFVLDWIVHIPDLPLFGADSFKIGLGLWRNLGLALAFEAALVVFGFVYYLVAIKPKSNLSRYGLGGLLLFTTAMTVMGMWFATTPPPTMGAAMSWILQPFLICGLAYRFDKPS